MCSRLRALPKSSADQQVPETQDGSVRALKVEIERLKSEVCENETDHRVQEA